jgi:cytochrome c oxidase assembly protein subunit 15
VVLTLPLLLLGAEVTTRGVGMVDTSGHSHLREPLIMVRQWLEGTLFERGIGYVIEHGHRLQGIVVGICTIILALGLWFGARRRWMRWLGPASLLAIIGQGLLGVFRVDLHALMGENLALIHGCTAQLVFGLFLSIAVFTSRFWQAEMNNNTENNLAPKLSLGMSAPETPIRETEFRAPTFPSRVWARGCTERRSVFAGVALLVYGQLVLGGLVRHTTAPLWPRLHVLAAFVVTGAVVWMLHELFAGPGRARRQLAAGWLLGGLLLVQVSLGLEAWLIRFPAVNAFGQALPPARWSSGLVRSMHYVIGSLVFAVVLVLTLWAYRPALRRSAPPDTAAPSRGRLEGVA